MPEVLRDKSGISYDKNIEHKNPCKRNVCEKYLQIYFQVDHFINQLYQLLPIATNCNLIKPVCKNIFC